MTNRRSQVAKAWREWHDRLCEQLDCWQAWASQGRTAELWKRYEAAARAAERAWSDYQLALNHTRAGRGR